MYDYDEDPDYDPDAILAAKREIVETDPTDFPALMLEFALAWIGSLEQATPTPRVPYDKLCALPIDDCTPLQLIERMLGTDAGIELVDRFRSQGGMWRDAVDAACDEISDEEAIALVREWEGEAREQEAYEFAHRPGAV